jgi:hypothetical protein
MYQRECHFRRSYHFLLTFNCGLYSLGVDEESM